MMPAKKTDEIHIKLSKLIGCKFEKESIKKCFGHNTLITINEIGEHVNYLGDELCKCFTVHEEFVYKNTIYYIYVGKNDKIINVLKL